MEGGQSHSVLGQVFPGTVHPTASLALNRGEIGICETYLFLPLDQLKTTSCTLLIFFLISFKVMNDMINSLSLGQMENEKPGDFLAGEGVPLVQLPYLCPAW